MSSPKKQSSILSEKSLQGFLNNCFGQQCHRPAADVTGCGVGVNQMAVMKSRADEYSYYSRRTAATQKVNFSFFFSCARPNYVIVHQKTQRNLLLFKIFGPWYPLLFIDELNLVIFVVLFDLHTPDLSIEHQIKQESAKYINNSSQNA